MNKFVPYFSLVVAIFCLVVFIHDVRVHFWGWAICMGILFLFNCLLFFLGLRNMQRE
jgi:Ca2+/Na+ antiporter